MMDTFNDTISIFLIDDQLVYRTGFNTVMQDFSGIQNTGHDSNGKDALVKIGKTPADVILVGLNKPMLNEFGDILTIRKNLPKTKILVLSIHDNENYILEVIRLGVVGYIMKDSHPEEIFKAIRSVHNNSPYYSSSISTSFIKKHSKVARTARKPFAAAQLTPRETDVLKLIVNGYTNKRIAKKLSISVRTVETHREHITQKLNIKTVAELTKYAISKGLTDIK